MSVFRHFHLTFTKELLVEILFELKRIENGIDDVERSIRIYSD